MNMKLLIFPLVVFIGLNACNSQPEPIIYGTDSCHNCKMTMMDERFGGELVTNKGKVFKFDDLICMRQFLRSPTMNNRAIKHLVIVNYQKNGEWLPVEKAFFLKSKHIKSPMGSNTAAFSSREDARSSNIDSTGSIINWVDLEKTPL